MSDELARRAGFGESVEGESAMQENLASGQCERNAEVPEFISDINNLYIKDSEIEEYNSFPLLLLALHQLEPMLLPPEFVLSLPAGTLQGARRFGYLSRASSPFTLATAVQNTKPPGKHIGSPRRIRFGSDRL